MHGLLQVLVTMVWDAFLLGQIPDGKMLPRVCGAHTLHCGRGGIKIPGSLQVGCRCFHLDRQCAQLYKYDSKKKDGLLVI